MTAATRLAACLLVCVATAMAVARPAAGQAVLGSAFIHQGVLTDDGVAATGLYDFQVTLFDAATGGTAVGAPSTVTREDVPVASGVYLLNLDFGLSAFGGQRRWLAIAVRPGASAGAFTSITPRREVLPAPIAIQADSADTLAGVACASGQLLVWTGTGWGCRADATGVGTVRSVTAGAGLTANGVAGGTITTTGTLAIANGGITEPMLGTAVVNSSLIVPGAVNLTHVAPNLVQARLANACAEGTYLAGVDEVGTPLCERVLVLPSGGSVGASVHTTSSALALALSPDGTPMVAYLDTSANVRVARCGDPNCTSVVSDVVVDAAASPLVDDGVALVVPPDGRPLVAYRSGPAGLKLLRCGNDTCTSGNRGNELGATATAQYPVMTLGANGLPVIAYGGGPGSGRVLQVRACDNLQCSTSTATSFESATSASIAVDSGGVPVVAFSTAAGVKVLHCGDSTCSSNRTVTLLRANATRPSLTFGAGGYPVVAYHDPGLAVTGGLGIVRCGTATCASGNVDGMVDIGWTAQVGETNAIAPRPDGHPWLAYRTAFGPSLELIRCGTADCVTRDVSLTLDGGFVAGSGLVMASSPSGLPVVAYHDRSASTIRLVRCGTVNCQ